MSKFAAGGILGTSFGLFIQILFFNNYILNYPNNQFEYVFLANGMMINFTAVITIAIILTIAHQWLKKFKFYRETE